MKKLLSLLLAVLLFASLLVACGDKSELKKGTIEKSGDESTNDSAWKPLTTAARTELDAVYQQKLVGTQAFAAVPETSGTTYYISSINGSDSNDGKSPAKAWASPKKANNAKSGDLVLFECGSVFRRTSNETFVSMKSGVTYATYGTGAKPIFYGSINASDPNKWVKVSGNLYYYKEQIGVASNDVGSIVFNDGEAWGIKVQMTYKTTKGEGTRGNKTLPLTGVSNGLQTGLSVREYKLESGKDLQGPDLCFYHDTKYVYLYCEGGNPGTRFSSIEFSQSKYAFSGDSGISNVTVLNLDFRNFGDHCVHTFDCTNLTVKNCEFRFVGGTVQMQYGDWRNYDTRLGNAVENWNSCNGMVVENCFFDQIFDTAMTTQSNSAVSTQNVTYRNNVAQNMWFGVELWTVSSGVVFDNVDVSGNYFKNIGEGFCSQRPDKNEYGYSINAFIKFSTQNHQLTNYTVTDNVSDGTNGKMVFCAQLKTKDNPNGAVFDRNTYVGTTDVDFARFFGKTDGEGGRTYSYTSGGIAAIHALGVETNSTFYYTEGSGQSFNIDHLIDSLPTYTYKAKNGVNLPFRLIFPEGYTAGASYPLVTFLNQESASGNDNYRNVTMSKAVISKLASENKAIVLVPQCPSGTWTGLAVNNGNYSISSVSENDVMKAVAAMIRDVADEFKTGKKYAVGVDAGAYAVSDLLARHKDLLTAGVIISGAGDPSASIGNAKVMIVHTENDEIIPYENANALATAWSAKYVFYSTDEYWSLQHDCWDYAAENEDILDWLLTK